MLDSARLCPYKLLGREQVGMEETPRDREAAVCSQTSGPRAAKQQGARWGLLAACWHPLPGHLVELQMLPFLLSFLLICVQREWGPPPTWETQMERPAAPRPALLLWASADGAEARSYLCLCVCLSACSTLPFK